MPLASRVSSQRVLSSLSRLFSRDILLLKGSIANNRETASLDVLDRLGISLFTICASGELLRVQEINKFSRTLER